MAMNSDLIPISGLHLLQQASFDYIGHVSSSCSQRLVRPGRSGQCLRWGNVRKEDSFSLGMAAFVCKSQDVALKTLHG